MTNSEIIEALNITAKLMELHNENPFKLKAYANAAFKLKKMRYDFEGKSEKEIENIDGIGKYIAIKQRAVFAQAHDLIPHDAHARRDLPDGAIDLLPVFRGMQAVDGQTDQLRCGEAEKFHQGLVRILDLIGAGIKDDDAGG